MVKWQQYDAPDNLRYHKEHTWVRAEGPLILVGLTDFAQQLAGEISYVDLPEEGDEIVKDRPMGKVETGKWVGKLYAPVTGSVEALNEAVLSDPAAINKEPYARGFLLKVRPSGQDPLAGLLDARAYVAAMQAKKAELKL